MAFIFIPENPNAQGTPESDSIIDGDNANRILGFAGDDTITGEGGADELFGNEGDDLLFGGAGIDSVYGGRGNDRIFGDGEGDFLFGNLGNDIFFGGGGNDQIFGGRDSDDLSGDAGDDLLSGDLGFDVLTGGLGRDTFALSPSADNSFDRIRDFNPSEDVIRLGGGVTFDSLQILTVAQAGLADSKLADNFSTFTVFSSSDIVIRARSSGQILGVLQGGVSLTPASLTAANFTS